MIVSPQVLSPQVLCVGFKFCKDLAVFLRLYAAAKYDWGMLLVSFMAVTVYGGLGKVLDLRVASVLFCLFSSVAKLLHTPEQRAAWHACSSMQPKEPPGFQEQARPKKPLQLTHGPVSRSNPVEATNHHNRWRPKEPPNLEDQPTTAQWAAATATTRPTDQPSQHMTQNKDRQRHQ